MAGWSRDPSGAGGFGHASVYTSRTPAALWGIHRTVPLVCLLGAQSFALMFVSMGSQDGLCASVPSSGRAEYVVNGFTLTSDRVITSFQDTEGPAAKSWTSLLKGKEESPEVGEDLSRTTEPLCLLSPAASGVLQRAFPLWSRQALPVLPKHGVILPISQMGKPRLE